MWYGNPVEVWSTVTSQDIIFIPLTFIKSRTAHITSFVNFGRVIGEDKVLVAVPLSK